MAALVIKNGVDLPDPEHAFGYAARVLLAPGLTGLMIACILAANMSTCSNFMVNLGALFTRDLYEPYVNPKADDHHILWVGRLSGLSLTLAGVFFALIVRNVLSAFLFVETIAAFMGILIVGGLLWRRANRYGALAAVLVAYGSYYLLNFWETGSWMLIYRWQAEPFGWAMLAGCLTLVLVSLLTPAEDPERIEAYFHQMENLSRADRRAGESPLAADHGLGLILLDLPGWIRRGRRRDFGRRYREDWLGFLLAWGFVGFLVLMAWLVVQL